jgi:hypothetical protein
MNLRTGRCYSVLLTDNTVVEFYFHGVQSGQVMVESPPASGNLVTFHSLITSYQAYWEIDCPD